MKRVEELGISEMPWTVSIGRQMSGNEAISVVSSDVEVARCYSAEDAAVIASSPKLYKNAYEVMESLKIHLLPKHQIVSINRRDIEAMVELLSSALSDASTGVYNC